MTNAGGPPPGMWSDWSREDFIKALDANMLTPIALMQAVLPGMIERGWGRVVNITSQSVKSPIAALGLSNTARTGLTGFVAGTSRQVAPKGVVINNLLPGIHDTDRAASLDRGVAEAKKIDLDAARAERMATIPARRYGTPGGVRRGLRLPVLAARGVHRRAELAAGRRGAQQHPLMRVRVMVA